MQSVGFKIVYIPILIYKLYMLRNMKFPTILYTIKENVDLFGKITHLL